MVAGGEDISQSLTTLGGKIRILMINYQFITDFAYLVIVEWISFSYIIFLIESILFTERRMFYGCWR